MKQSVRLKSGSVLARSALFLSAVFCLPRANAAEWHVYAEEREGVKGPRQVVNAINLAGSDDTIVVHAGTYDFTGVSMTEGSHLSISKSLHVCGESSGRWTGETVFKGTVRGMELTDDVALTVSGITFEGFNAESGKGGAILFKSNWVADSAAHGDGTYMSNCVVRSCKAKIAGGVSGGLAIDCLFDSNSASSYTGAAQGTRVIGCTFRGNTATSYYGALENPAGCYDSLFEGNSVKEYSSALSINGNCGTVVSNCTFKGNVCGGNIGTVGIEGATTRTPTFIDCTFEANRGAEGSAIGMRRSTQAVPLFGCRFVCNTNTAAYAQDGGTLFSAPLDDQKEFAFPSYYQATDCQFVSNYCCTISGVAAGGAFTNCTFVGNLANPDSVILAGDCFNVRQYCPLDLKGCTFSDHTYGFFNYGGGVAVAGNGKCRIEDCLFANNSHTYGAAIYVAGGGTCDVYGSRFLTNSCNQVGGAVYVEPGSTTLFSNCWFEANWCTIGSAVYGGEYHDCTFATNKAHQGVAYGATVYDSRFVGNYLDTADYTVADAESCRLVRCNLDGGSICLCSLDSCRIHNVALDRSKSRCVFYNANWATNCLIDHCYGDWGIVYSSRGKRSADTEDVVPEWVNCTFADNCFWTWYGFYCHDGGQTQLALFENCIFSNNRFNAGQDHKWSDQGVECNFSVYNQMDPAGVTFRNCLYGPLVGGAGCSTDFTDGGGNLPNTDPKFARGAKGLPEYALPRRSPAYNAGITRPWHQAAFDYAGNARVFDGIVDIGCYECNIPRPGMCILFR